ncbi:hypothetical protein HALLA_20580 (plasmid) [Halostagnicola larsenii XH-48]|uniref:Uncharacterized protein n=2 Tax=Halostagnicola larsenii TaxID=353800 RepID=W0JUQ7_9EURY|nr:hypothetical protein HALLA_20580 [Halostagnicola larsenii XH-48]
MKQLLVLSIVTVAVLSAGCSGPGGAPEEEEPVPEESPAEPVTDESSSALEAKSHSVLTDVPADLVGSMTASIEGSATELCVYV